MYCYSNNGQSMRAVSKDYTVRDGEVLFDREPTETELTAAFPDRAVALAAMETESANDAIKQQIIDLEATQLRTMREIALGGTDLTRLQAIEDQIVALRAQLQ